MRETLFSIDRIVFVDNAIHLFPFSVPINRANNFDASMYRIGQRCFFSVTVQSVLLKCFLCVLTCEMCNTSLSVHLIVRYILRGPD